MTLESEDNGNGHNGDSSARGTDERRTLLRLQRRGGGNGSAIPEPDMHETVLGSKPRSGDQQLRRVVEGGFEATKAASLPQTGLGQVYANVRRVVIGEALASSQ